MGGSHDESLYVQLGVFASLSLLDSGDKERSYVIIRAFFPCQNPKY